jgi:hypothetical protein
VVNGNLPPKRSSHSEEAYHQADADCVPCESNPYLWHDSLRCVFGTNAPQAQPHPFPHLAPTKSLICRNLESYWLSPCLQFGQYLAAQPTTRHEDPLLNSVEIEKLDTKIQLLGSLEEIASIFRRTLSW